MILRGSYGFQDKQLDFVWSATLFIGVLSRLSYRVRYRSMLVDAIKLVSVGLNAILDTVSLFQFQVAIGIAQ